jgi:hypothetical protein
MKVMKVRPLVPVLKLGQIEKETPVDVSFLIKTNLIGYYIVIL